MKEKKIWIGLGVNFTTQQIPQLIFMMKKFGGRGGGRGGGGRKEKEIIRLGRDIDNCLIFYQTC